MTDPTQQRLSEIQAVSLDVCLLEPHYSNMRWLLQLAQHQAAVVEAAEHVAGGYWALDRPWLNDLRRALTALDQHTTQ